jgi:ribosomal protein S18 acetylase RimI-like enzyme
MLEIKEISTKAQLEQTTVIVQSAFAGIAQAMDLTQQNAPSHPAFTTLEKMSAMQQKMPFFGLYLDGDQIGCVAIEKAGDTIYYMERLAVLPAHRHAGCGALLVGFVLDYARERRGKKVSLGMINSHTVLKDWYKSLGFVETGTKQFEGLPFVVCFLEKEVST